MIDAAARDHPSARSRIAFWTLIVALCCLRLTHVHLLWADEDYHLAAALNLLHGKIPYRDFWYDKPPLCSIFYLLCGAHAGWALRLLDAAYVFSACLLIFRLARDLWGEEEARIAAFLLSFFLAFYFPSAVISFAADGLMLVSHLAAIFFAARKRTFLAGIWCGIAFLFNVKAIFVAATCLLWMPAAVLSLIAGFLIPVLAALAAALAAGAWAGYYEQVWRWGLIYAANAPVSNPLALAVRRTLDWLGFHAALVPAAIYSLMRADRLDRWRLTTWIGLSFMAVCVGGRFAPHYFIQLLPPLVIAAARGVALIRRQRPGTAMIAAGLLLSVPFIRFLPAYVTLAAADLRGVEPHWTDVVLDLDSQDVARRILAVAQPGDTLFVWGYRPDMYVYTRLVPDSLFSDSQPLTGVPADRHLREAKPVYSAPAAANRTLLTRSHPTFIVDALGLINPSLAPSNYPEIRGWLREYHAIGHSKLSIIYQRKRYPGTGE